MTVGVAEPLLFGPAEAALFGVYDPPRTTVDRDLGVVICPPFGREHLLCHRALRQLATNLACEGFHVLRFDFRGCGDSSGELEAQDLDAWIADVGHAADDLLDRTGLDRVALVGLRLGATLALLGARRRGDVEALVLWEPVLEGAAHVAELVTASAAERRERKMEETPAGEDGVSDVCGFPVSAALRRGLETLSFTFDRRPARRALLLRDAPLAEDEPVVKSLERAGVTFSRAEIARARIWLPADGDEARALVPAPTLQRIVDWLAGRSP